MEKYAQYSNEMESVEGRRARRSLMKPVLNLFHGELNGKRFRTLLDEFANEDNGEGIGDVMLRAMRLSGIPDDVLDDTSPVAEQLNTAPGTATL